MIVQILCIYLQCGQEKLLAALTSHRATISCSEKLNFKLHFKIRLTCNNVHSPHNSQIFIFLTKSFVLYLSSLDVFFLSLLQLLVSLCPHSNGQVATVFGLFVTSPILLHFVAFAVRILSPLKT